MSKKESERAFICEFIETYRCLPALWDVTSPDYANREKKAEQYKILTEKYREHFPNAEKVQVTKKINSLRTNFRKELKRLREQEKSGAGVEDAVPSLWYFQKLNFLANQEVPTASTSTMDTSSACNEHAMEAEPPKKRQKRKDPADELLKLAIQRLNKPKDALDKCAEVWASEIRGMDHDQQLLVKKAINEVIFEGQMGSLHRHSVQINKSNVLAPVIHYTSTPNSSSHPSEAESFYYCSTPDGSSQNTS